MKFLIKTITMTLFLSHSVFATTNNLQSVNSSKDEIAQIENTIPAVAASAGVFNTLLAAVTAADLAGVLNSKGPFTVFAPTDDAFAALPVGTIEFLLKPENKEQLIDILLYHVLSGKVLAETAINLASSNSMTAALNGDQLKLSLEGDVLKINESTVISTDVMASNGVIHVIDSVLLPPVEMKKDIIEIAAEAGSFNTLLAAVEAAGLVDLLQTKGPFTLFAPTDSAFSALPVGALEFLLQPENSDMLTKILTNHVVEGDFSSTEIMQSHFILASNGLNLIISLRNGELFINNSKVIIKDIKASNGTIQVIDAVLVP